MTFKTAIEIERGCKQYSTLFPVALEVRDRFISGETVPQIANSYRDIGVTEAMVAGHIHRNKPKWENPPAAANSDEVMIEAEVMPEAPPIVIPISSEVPPARKLTIKLAVAETPLAPPVGTKGKMLINMRGCQCWWPIGAQPRSPSEQFFCADRTEQGSTFCEEHRKVAYVPPKFRIRA